MYNATYTTRFMLAAVAVCVLTAATILTSCGGGGGGGGASGPANSAPIANTPTATGGTSADTKPTPYLPPARNPSDITFTERNWLAELDAFLAEKDALGDTTKIYVVKMPAESESALTGLKDIIKKYPNVKVDLDLYDLPTTVLPEYCFYPDDVSLINLVGLTLPKNTKTIEMVACYDLPNLKALYIPNGVERIGEWGISCTGLTEVNIPPSVKAITQQAFWQCPNLESVTLHNGLQEIGQWAFEECPLTEIDIPGSVKKIGDSAFYNCKNLERVTLHDGVEEIEPYAFKGCISLTAIDIPASVKKIEKSTFYNCINLEKITLHDGLKEIGPWAFEACTSLTAIDIPASVKKIEQGTFYNCVNLRKITLHDGLEEIGEAAFCIWDEFPGNDKLTSIDIPKTVKKISYQAFRKCKALKNVTLHEGLQTISGLAFHMTGIESITIPSTVTHIADEPGRVHYRYDPFASCPNLRTITVAPGNKHYKVGYGGCLYTFDEKELITYPNARGDTSFTVPVNTSLRSRSFKDKDKLRTLIIPEGTADIFIGYESFSGLTPLTEVTLPSNVTKIECSFIGTSKKVFMSDTTSQWKRTPIDDNFTEEVFTHLATTEAPFGTDGLQNSSRLNTPDPTKTYNYRFEKIVD